MGKFCDFELRLNGQAFPVHKLVLASCSPYFEAMFNNKENFIENSENFSELHDVDIETCELLLDYIYTGEINITQLNVQDITRVSSMFQLLELVDYCSKYMENCLTVKNSIGIVCFADFYSLHNLCYKGKRFVERNFAEVCHEEEFLELPFASLRTFLLSENLSIDSECQVLCCTLNWILKDKASRLQHLDEFINLIRMPLITPSQIQNFLDNCKDEDINSALSPYLQSTRITESSESGIETKSYHLIRFQPRMCCRRRIYVLGGLSIRFNDRLSSHTLNSMIKFNLHTGSWDQGSCFFYPRSSHCVVRLNDLIYMIGGECDSLILDSMEIFNLERQEAWGNGPNLKHPRSSFGACEFGNNIYVFGGKGNYSGNTIERYDPQQNVWTVHEKMPNHLQAMEVIQHDGLIYIIGGRSNNQTLASLTSYNPAAHEFKVLASMNMARSDFGCAVLHGNIFVIGGLDANNEPLATVEQYNITEV